MRRLALALTLFAASPASALPEACGGTDLIAALPEADRAALTAATEAAPFPRGNLWRATRDGAGVTLVGTYHLDDPRHDATLAALAPALGAAVVLLVEAGPEEERQMMARLARDPSIMLTPADQPTLREVLAPAEWDSFAAALSARGIPAFMAARFRPWYVSMLLSIPPCAMPTRATADRGLDKRLMQAALAQGLPLRALEPYDTAFRIFEAMSADTQVDMIRTALALEPQAEDQMVTLANAYFAEDSRLIWEYLRHVSLRLPGAAPAAVEAEFAQMEEALMSARNRAWVPVIEAAAAEGPVVAAFGSLHLSGRDGVLALMQRAGWTLERLPFPAAAR